MNRLLPGHLFAGTGRRPDFPGSPPITETSTAEQEDGMFEMVVPPAVDGSAAGSGGAGNPMRAKGQAADHRPADGSPRKIMLPRGDGEPRFGPQPYYYEASRTGVVPGRAATP